MSLFMHVRDPRKELDHGHLCVLVCAFAGLMQTVESGGWDLGRKRVCLWLCVNFIPEPVSEGSLKQCIAN